MVSKSHPTRQLAKYNQISQPHMLMMSLEITIEEIRALHIESIQGVNHD
jgi:hypothetical protein